MMSNSKRQYINAITTQFNGMIQRDSISMTKAIFLKEALNKHRLCPKQA